jgi:glutathione S-transferase
MYQLYIANKNYSSWSLRPWLLMREHGISFEEIITPFAGARTAETFRKVSPNSRVPCLRDGELVVWDSLAITEYLAERHPGLWPGDVGARAFARCAVAEMHSGFSALRHTCSMSCGVRVRLHEVSAALAADLARLSELWNEGLSRFGGPFLAGRTFTAVDAFFAPVAFRAQTYDLPLDATAAAYAARLRDLTSMREWYAAALLEPWRDEDDEARIAQHGTVHTDLRAPQ